MTTMKDSRKGVETREAVQQARASFVRKWRMRCKAVVSSFEEGGEELFTFHPREA